MINIKQIENSSLIVSPFRYSIISNFIYEKDAAFLLNNLPDENNYRSIRNEGNDKTYNVVNNILLKLGDNVPNEKSNLSKLWISLVKELQSVEYITGLSNLLREDLFSCHQEITLKRYGYNDYISPHTDQSQVRATHMLFLNSHWADDWGGKLCFMYDPENVFIEFMPISKYSVVFVRSDISWHSVQRITNPNVERIAIQVAFWNITERHVQNGRIEHAVKV